MVQFGQNFTLWVWRWPQHLQEAQVGDIQWGIEYSRRKKGNVLCNEKQKYLSTYIQIYVIYCILSMHIYQKYNSFAF